jgi:hypothetical protein
MTRRWMLNLVLLLILTGLVWLIRMDLIATRMPPTLAGIGTPEPHLIEIARDGEPTILFERLDSGWRMRAPWDLDADDGRIDALLAIRDAPLLRSVPQAAAALDELGLEPVKLRLRLDTTDIAIGRTDPIANGRYLASDGLIHLIPDRFHHLLIAPPIDYAARGLIPRATRLAFATLDDTPLSSATLERIEGLTAERLEPLTGDPRGARLVTQTTDGQRIEYQISDDGRRWTRLDLQLRYVLSEALDLDPATPGDPGGLAAAAALHAAPEPEQGLEAAWPIPDPASRDLAAEPFAAEPNETEMSEPYDPLEPVMDPEAPLSGDLPLGPPPSVRLKPHAASEDPRPDAQEPWTELRRELPAGFGQDPFAPDWVPSSAEDVPREPMPGETLADDTDLADGRGTSGATPAGFGSDPFAPDDRSDPSEPLVLDPTRDQGERDLDRDPSDARPAGFGQDPFAPNPGPR